MKFNQNTLSVLTVVLLAGMVLFIWSRMNTSPTHNNPENVACTLDAMLCPDGSSVGRVGPECEFAQCPTTTPTSTPPDDIEKAIDAKSNLIMMESPRRDMVITSPATITGRARGTWFFEASFPIAVVDWDGRIIGEGHAEATSDWMTTEFVPFTATVNFTVPTDTPYRRGALILRKDNPSGLPEHDDALEVPVRF